MNKLLITKPGINALTATDPNDFIFNSDYNTPMIIKEATDSTALGTTGSETFRNVAHSLNYTPFTLGFCKFANNRVGAPGTKASNADFWFTNLRVNATNVRFGYNNFTGGNYTPTFKYLATEIPLAGTPSITQVGGNRLIIAKPGTNALTNTNPNNLIYDSRWPTLKYFSSGNSTINVPETTPAATVSATYEVVLTTHSLGYYPFFGSSIELMDDPGLFYIAPVVFEDSGFWIRHMVYCSTTQLIYRFEGGNAFGGIPAGGMQIKVYWKIFSKDLGL
jgi:hypothetical protein